MHIQRPGVDCCSPGAAIPCRRGHSLQERSFKGGVTIELSLHWCFSSHEVLGRNKGLQTDERCMGSGQYHTCRDGLAALPRALNVPSVACFSMLWQPRSSPSDPNHSKKKKKIMKANANLLVLLHARCETY